MTERTTSAAKDTELESYRQKSLDAYKQHLSGFNDAANNNTASYAQEANQSGSSMVQQDQPAYNYRPPPEIADAQDLQTFNDKWDAEDANAQELRAQSLEAYRESLASMPDNSHEDSYDHSR